MQRIFETEPNTILQKLKFVVGALTWVAGLILAGSDGEMMPYLNMAGLVLFAAANLWLVRQSARKREAAPVPPKGFSWAGQGKQVARSAAVRMMPVTPCGERGAAVRSRYARELGVV